MILLKKKIYVIFRKVEKGQTFNNYTVTNRALHPPRCSASHYLWTLNLFEFWHSLVVCMLNSSWWGTVHKLSQGSRHQAYISAGLNDHSFKQKCRNRNKCWKYCSHNIHGYEAKHVVMLSSHAVGCSIFVYICNDSLPYLPIWSSWLMFLTQSTNWS